MPVATQTVTDAHLAQQHGAIYIDVRSSAEFAEGRPAGAINVPLLDHDEDTGQLMPNPDFVRVIRANFPANTSLLIGCQTGGRSARAAQILEAFGFTHVTNVQGGFAGWEPSGLPTERGPSAGRTYDALLSAADAASE